MAQIIGSSEAAEQFNLQLVKQTKALVEILDFITKSLQALEKSMQDEEIQKVKESVNRVQKKTKDTLPDIKNVCDKVKKYGEILDKSIMKTGK